MKIAQLAKDEPLRLKALESYNIMDTDFEAAYDELVDLASYICKTPITLISLIDTTRQWFKAAKGLNVRETSRDVAFCSHAIIQDDIFIVPNSDEDERFADNPLVTDAPFVKFYAGVPLVTKDGFSLGTLCAIDNKPRQLDPEQIEALKKLARQAVRLLELRLAEQKMTKLIEGKEKYISILAHDLRSPFSGLLTLTEILKDSWKEFEEQKVAQFLNELHKASSNTFSLLNNLLAWSVADGGHMECTIEPLSLDKAIETVVLELFYVLKAKSISVQLSGPKNLVLMADSNMLHSLIQNLLSNAIKFSDAGSIVYLKTLENHLEGGLEVEDQGKGMTQEKINAVFTPGAMRSENGTKGEKGTGLGLALCNQFTQYMKGKLEITSTVEAGTTIGFLLAKALI